MAVHCAPRGTRDVDLLAVATECLNPETWQPLETQGIAVDVRRGGADDPLAGVVRFSSTDVDPLDLIVGRAPWQEAMLARAREAVVSGVAVPVVTAADLIVLKLYAGGPQDAWDIEQLLAAAGDRGALVADVDGRVGPLSPRSMELWQRIRG